MNAWPRAPRLYEINTRVWLRELSGQAQRRLTLAEVPEAELDAIAAAFDAVWLMGVWTTGPAAVAEAHRPDRLEEWRRALPDADERDVPGSPYAISAYAVAPELGGDAALRILRERLAGRGLRLMLDFVPNHTARDHPWLQSRPNVFVRGAESDLLREPHSFFRTRSGAVVAHGRDPYFPAWTDTAQVNYGHSDGREAMCDVLMHIATLADGARCDMAMLLLPEVIERVWSPHLGLDWTRASFWAWAIPQVRAIHPAFLFLAEAYWGLEARLQTEGFDFTYDKALYDRLHTADVAGVRAHLARSLAAQRRDARFVENHDEPRAPVFFGPRAHAAAVVTYLSPGLKLLYEGQLEGRRVRLPVQLGRRPDEPLDRETQAFYRRLLAILTEPAFGGGDFALADVAPAGAGDTTHEPLVAFWRAGVPAAPPALGWLVVSNLGPHRSYARVRLPPAFPKGVAYRFDDRLNGVVYDRDGAELRNDGLFVALGPYASHVFSIAAAN